MLYGTGVYNGSIRLPGYDYDEPAEEGPAGMKVRTPKAMASPALGKSPLITRQAERQRAELEGPSVELAMTDRNRTFNEI